MLNAIQSKVFVTLNSATIALAAVTATGLLFLSARPTHATPPAGYTLVWHDEFNGAVGSAPNSANWSYDTGAGGWGNAELETYTTSLTNAEIVSDSSAPNGRALAIIATHTGGNYDSARIKTLGKEAPLYGYFEASVNHPTGSGLWPAWWMLGSDYPSAGWPECGEIDIFEQFEANPTNEFSSFYYGTSSALQSWQNNISVSASGYNTYALLWTSSTTEEYYNGTGYGSHANPGSPFNASFNFYINLAVGGNPGGVGSNTVFPSSLKMGYLRVYEPSSSASSTTTTSSTSTAASSSAASSTTSSTSSGSGVGNGTYSIYPEFATGSRLDDSGSGTGNGNKIDLWQSTGGANQKWAFSTTGVTPAGDYNLATLGAYCLQIVGTVSGDNTELWACDGASTQSWSISKDSSPSGYYQLKPANATNLCLDVYGASSANGAIIDTYTCNSGSNQQWGGL